MVVAEALPKLRRLGVPIERPSDYFAEMVKTDDHMQKVGFFTSQYNEYDYFSYKEYIIMKACEDAVLLINGPIALWTKF